MSLIINKPRGSIIEKEIFEKCFKGNSDGIGFAYCLNNQIHIRKVFKTLDNFYKEYLPIEDNECLINFAEKDYPISTKRFCGPFKLDDNHVLVHVGDFCTTENLGNKEESQTANLVNFIKTFWNPKFFGKFYLKWMIEENLSSDNVIVIMNNCGETQTFNKFKGVEFKNVWFSESPYKYSRYPNTSSYFAPKPEQNTKDYRYGYARHDHKIERCEDCNRECLGGSVTTYFSGIKRIICSSCNILSKKIIKPDFNQKNQSEANNKGLNSFLGDVLKDPSIVDVFDLF